MKYRDLCAPVSVQLEVTEACNLDCLHCYNHWRDKSKKYTPSRLNYKKINNIADLLIEAGVCSVTITGGEPLLFWRILPGAIQKMTSAGVDVGLNSNLSFLTDEIAASLKNSGLKRILVSVLSSREEVHDSITGQKGSWQKTIAGIKKAKEFGFCVSSNTVLLKSNHQYLRETAKFMKELGISSFCATKASPALNARDFAGLILSREELRASLDELVGIKRELGMEVDILECYPLCLIGDISKFSFFARRSCTAGVSSCTIGPTGDIRPCSHADMVYGNLFQEEFLKIWQKMSDWREARYIPDECQSCKFVGHCSGGCRMEAKYYGNINGRDPFMTGQHDVNPSISASRVAGADFILPDGLKVNDSLKIREESFGATVSVYGKAIFINSDAMRILSELKTRKEFTAHSIIEEYGLKIEPANRFLRSLLQNSIIQKSR